VSRGAILECETLTWVGSGTAPRCHWEQNRQSIALYTAPMRFQASSAAIL
jgi:hypothetical protein